MTYPELWVCEPCYEMVPQSYGLLYTHGGTSGRVWCPWCGDAMDAAGDLLDTDELEQIKADLVTGINAYEFADEDPVTDGGGRNAAWVETREVFYR